MNLKHAHVSRTAIQYEPK